MNALNYLYRGVYSYFSHPLGGGGIQPRNEKFRKKRVKKREKIRKRKKREKWGKKGEKRRKTMLKEEETYYH